MSYLERCVKWVLPQASAEDDRSWECGELRRNKRLFAFTLVATCAVLIIFSLLHLLSSRFVSGISDVIILFTVVGIGIFYRKTGYFKYSVLAYTLSVLSLVAFHHFITPHELAANMLFLPVTIVVISFLAGRKAGFVSALYGTSIFILADIFKYRVPAILSDNYQVIDSITTDVFLFIASSYVVYFMSSRILKEQNNFTNELYLREMELKRMNDFSSALISVVVHDIATPLTVVKGRLMIIENKMDLTKVTKEWTSALQFLDVIDDIIFDAKQLKAHKQGKITVELEEVELKKSLEMAIESLTSKASYKNIQLNFVCTDNEYFAMAETKSVYASVFNNLISNAIKFSSPDAKIDISLSKDDEHIIFQIRDYGVGIPMDLHDKLFDFREKTTRSGTSGEVGTGFGLPILKMYVDSYEAKINVESRTQEDDPRDHGTTFTIRFNKA